MTMKIDDDHFEYECGMRQCISGFGRNAKECLQDLASHPNSDAAWKSCQWHIDELVRWCRELNRELKTIRLSAASSGMAAHNDDTSSSQRCDRQVKQ